MTTLLRSPAGRGSLARIKPSAIERSLARYPARQRCRISALASRHRRLADLAVTFPGLLFVLAAGERDCAEAVDLALAGARLKHVARAAGVPLWLRKLPPEAFAASFNGLPDDERFRRRIAGHMPTDPELTASWLTAVCLAAEYGDHDFAVWVAREWLQPGDRSRDGRLRLLALFAWYSRRPATLANRCLSAPWAIGMSFERALKEAQSWHETLELHLYLGGKKLEPWFFPATVMGFEFVPLVSADDIVQEAKIMRNCVRRYGATLAGNSQRLWSIRSEGERVATLSIDCNDPVPCISQLQGPANDKAPQEIWAAAWRWMIQHDPFGFREDRTRGSYDRSTWVALWRPYWLAKRRLPGWLPLAPSRSAMRQLRHPSAR